MTDRDALAREIRKATVLSRRALWPDIAADIALRHVADARVEALAEAALKCDHIAREFAGDSRHQESTVAVVCRDFIRALKDPPA